MTLIFLQEGVGNMNTIKLKELELHNFKCYATASFKFDDRTNEIKGITGLGKTSIKEAFLWSLGFDCDFAPKIDDCLVKGVQTVVKAVLEVNGINYTLQRTNTQKWKFNEDKATDEFNGNDSKFEFDEVATGSKDYEKKVAQLFDLAMHKFVRLVLDLSAFNTDKGTTWTHKERRAFLFALLNIDNKVKELAEQDKFEPIKEDLLKGKDENDIQKTLNAEKKIIADNIKKNKILIEDRTKIVNEYSKTDFDALYEQQIDFDTKIQELKKQILEIEIVDAHKAENLKLEIQKLNQDKEQLLSSAEQLEKASDNLLDMPITDTCPTCGQKLPEENIKAVKVAMELEKMDKMADMKKQAENLRFNAQNIQERVNTLENELQGLETVLNASQEYIQLKEELSKQVYALDGQLNGILYELTKKKSISHAQAEIQQLKDEIKQLMNKESKRLKKASVLKEYIEEKIKVTNEEVNKHFDGVSFKFFKYNTANAENEYQPTCECMLNGIAYNSLSQGQKIIADFATNNGLQKILELNAPQFIDNKQDNTFDMASDNQQIRLITCEESNIKATFIKDVFTIDDCDKKGE